MPSRPLGPSRQNSDGDDVALDEVVAGDEVAAVGVGADGRDEIILIDGEGGAQIRADRVAFGVDIDPGGGLRRLATAAVLQETANQPERAAERLLLS